MAETMILVPGRSQSQGTSLNEGKLKDEYKKVTINYQETTTCLNILSNVKFQVLAI